ncbi:MAG: hypothetical protein J6Q59_06910, partial [Paludibacteraceae bacterium]|nr:hypothetical protein [Paludibacteraceae bacterium]
IENGDAVEKKKSVGEWTADIFFGLIYALWAYVLGGFALPFGAMPFGVALLCASRRRTDARWPTLWRLLTRDCWI